MGKFDCILYLVFILLCYLFQDDRVPMEYGQMLQDIEASMYNLSAASILMKYLYKKRKQELISKYKVWHERRPTVAFIHVM